MTTAQVMFPAAAALWPLGTEVTAAGSDVVIGTVIAHGETHDGRTYAEIELTPAAMGIGYELPFETEEEDPFG
jgi:hypothetical protein